MESLEKPAKVTFLNQPQMSLDSADSEFNKRRVALVPHVENFLITNPLFLGQEVNVFFMTKGVGSLVCMIDTLENKYILKIPLNKTLSEGEAEFLNVWEKAGVKVPHVFSGGRIGDHSYTLMEYVEAETLGEGMSPEEFSESGYYTKMGRALHKMHEPKGKGYGEVVNGRAKFDSFKQWIEGNDVTGRIQYIRENNLLTSVNQDYLDKALEILLNFVGENTESSYCHDDFGASNIFDTDPITVFDPNPRFNNYYIDVGKTLANHILSGIYPKEFIDSYFLHQSYNKKVLLAATILNLCMKLRYAHKKNRTTVIKYALEYISQNGHLLSS